MYINIFCLDAVVVVFMRGSHLLLILHPQLAQVFAKDP